MADSVQWEYIVQTVGSLIRSPKDEEVQELLNAWGEEGWELVAATPMTNSFALKLVGKRLLTSSERRRKSMPET